MYEIVNRRGLSAVFPEGFSGADKDVLAAGKDTTVYSANGKVLQTDTTLSDFCGSLGIKPKSVKPNRNHHAFLDRLEDALGIERPVRPQGKGPKKGKPSRGKKPELAAPKELTPEQKAEQEIISRLKETFSTRTIGGSGGDRRRSRGPKRPTKLIFILKDRKDKDAEAVYKGNGKFEPLISPEDGTRTLARNRWAASQFSAKYNELFAEVFPPLAETEQAAS